MNHGEILIPKKYTKNPVISIILSRIWAPIYQRAIIMGNLDKNKRKELLEQAQKLGYSPDKLNDLMPYIENWNQDVVDNDKLDSFRIVEKFINDNQEPYKENILYKISQLFSDRGGNKNEN